MLALILKFQGNMEVSNGSLDMDSRVERETGMTWKVIKTGTKREKEKSGSDSLRSLDCGKILNCSGNTTSLVD